MGQRFTRFSRQKFFVWGNTRGFSLKHQRIASENKNVKRYNVNALSKIKNVTM